MQNTPQNLFFTDRELRICHYFLLFPSSEKKNEKEKENLKIRRQRKFVSLLSKRRSKSYKTKQFFPGAVSKMVGQGRNYSPIS